MMFEQETLYSFAVLIDFQNLVLTQKIIWYSRENIDRVSQKKICIIVLLFFLIKLFHQKIRSQG